MNEEEWTPSRKHLLKNGDLVFADAAEDNTVGKAVEISGAEFIKSVSGLHTIVARPIQKFAPTFLGHCINAQSYQKQLESAMQGIKVLSISKSNIKKTTITLPDSYDEQIKIAKLFNTIDHTITLHQRESKLNFEEVII
ncbi:restriction endonuclease subunit S [Macrococcus armenti]|uniref:Restriction endonuclease subunit S n=1 Tax=Macrococcus armenti TaxID=2875764 RepID=A0ABY3ZXP1_9STAP|nr:restriction endonuclease subunit S [Macrococcus armenti]UOB21628.1 restriction endonuclease subunit S [Macrococcus armenti]